MAKKQGTSNNFSIFQVGWERYQAGTNDQYEILNNLGEKAPNCMYNLTLIVEVGGEWDQQVAAQFRQQGPAQAKLCTHDQH